jgi:hypothetical protein
MVLFSFPPVYTNWTSSKEIELSGLKAKGHFPIDSRIFDTQKIGMGTPVFEYKFWWLSWSIW